MDYQVASHPLPRGLPVELFKLILSYIEPNHEQALPIDKAIASRQFLSVESLEPPDPSQGSVRDSLSTIGNFRLSCKVFEQIGAPFLFARVATRFSKDGLKKLERLSHWKHLACHVKRFTYLVPYFVKGELSDFDRLQSELRQEGVQAVDSLALRDKIREQRTTIALKEDARILKEAIASFTSLQLVQILRVANREDAMLSEFLQRHEEARTVINLDWTSACSHAARTVGTALLDSSNMEWNRFSLPMLSPTSAQFLKLSGPNSVQTLAERLSCLTLHFDDSEDLEAKLQDLSDLFKAVFSKAKKMKAIHIGFPSHRPLTSSLESIFHNVKWDDLVAFGINGWELEDAEIIGFLKRHKEKLRGVRLRDVHLKEGSAWREVLTFLRNELRHLQWVSLRRVGYTAYYNSPEYLQMAGAEVPPIDSDTESEDEDAPPTDPGPAIHDVSSGESQSDTDEDDDSAASDDEHGPAANDMDFPNLNSPDTPSSVHWCNCSEERQLDAASELRDDDIRVDNLKRKYWEKWVLQRCFKHDGR